MTPDRRRCDACGTSATHDPWSSSCAEELQHQRDEVRDMLTRSRLVLRLEREARQVREDELKAEIARLRALLDEARQREGTYRAELVAAVEKLAGATQALRTSRALSEMAQRQRDELIHLVRFLEWSGYVWRQREDGPGQYLIAGCPVCLVPKDSGAHGADCRLYELLVPKSHTAPVRDSGDA